MTDWSLVPKSFDSIPAIAFVTRRVYHDTEALIPYRTVNVSVRNAKYDGNRTQLEEIAHHISDVCLEMHAESVEWCGCTDTYILPVPTSPWRLMHRGFNHMNIVARTLRQRMTTTGCSVLHGLSSPLRRSYILHTPQALKDATARILDIPLFIRKRITTAPPIVHHVILVDDVVTTGSTLAGLAKALYTIHPQISLKKVAFAYSDFMHEQGCDRFDKRETWLSGRKYLTANEASPNRDRGFESLRLRT